MNRFQKCLAFLFFLGLATAEARPSARPITLHLSQIPRGEKESGPADLGMRKEGWEDLQLQKAVPAITQPQFVQRNSVVTTQTTPTILANFLGIPKLDPTAGIPPDPTIGVGPDQIVLEVNRTVAIYSKTGQRLFRTSLSNWFSGLPDAASAGLFDTKVLYDQYNKHFIVLCDAAKHGQGSWYFLSVSKTSNAQGDWVFWELDMRLNNSTRTNVFADFPGVGIDPRAIYLTGNMFEFSTGKFEYAKVRILKKSQVYGFKSLTWHDFINLFDPSGRKAMNVAPCHSFGSTTTEYLVDTDAVRGNQLTLWRITNPTTIPLLTKQAVPVASYEVPPNATQKGDGTLINTGDSGVLNAVYRDGSIYTAHAIAHNWASGSVSTLRYYQISMNGLVDEQITYGSDGLFYFYPVVMPDSRGNVIVAFNRSGPTEFPGFFFTGRSAIDPPGTLQKSFRLRAGRVNYQSPNSSASVVPWGDYNGIAWDANDSIWVYGEFAKTTTAWGTAVGRILYQ